MNPPLLSVENVRIPLQLSATQDVLPVSGVSFDVYAGEMVALVGESGCGKTLTAMSILGLLPGVAKKGLLGRISFAGGDLYAQTPSAWRKLRGRRIAAIFQEPASALNPVISMGSQISAVLCRHLGLSRKDAKKRTLELFAEVGLPHPEMHWSQYPSQMSGGMRQRAMIAMSLSCNPELLIADEPTTALDVTLQEHIMQLLRSLQRARRMACLLVTHDLALVSRFCDRVIIMYCGTVVEQGLAQHIFEAPRHPYTKALIESMPHIVEKPLHRLPVIAGQVPPLSQVPKGCPFADRCPRVTDVCWTTRPSLDLATHPAHAVACHHPLSGGAQ